MERTAPPFSFQKRLLITIGTALLLAVLQAQISTEPVAKVGMTAIQVVQL